MVNFVKSALNEIHKLIWYFALQELFLQNIPRYDRHPRYYQDVYTIRAWPILLSYLLVFPVQLSGFCNDDPGGSSRSKYILIAFRIQ
jgi:hypothetical protein